jgi:outer membrane receptor protein involved in Fe transport
MRVPGMITGGHEIHAPLIGTRGVLINSNAKTLVMIDEQQINQRSNFGYTSGMFSPLLGDINKIEIILGPGAILHGSGAINGFINLVPKNGEDNPGVFINSEYGFAEEFWKFETGYGTSYGKNKNIYLYGGIYDADGFEPDELYGASKDFDIDANGFDGDNYKLSLYWNHDNFNLNTFFYEDNPSKKTSIREMGHFHQATLGIRPKYIFEINSTDSFEIIGSLLWFDHSSPGIVDLKTGDIGDRGGAERHWEVKNIYKTSRWARHSLAMGFSYGEKHFTELKQFFSGDAVRDLGIPGTKWKEASIFSEDVIALNDSWTASLGLRYDKVYLSDMHHPSEFWPESRSPNEIKGLYSPRIATAYELDTTVDAILWTA